MKPSRFARQHRPRCLVFYSQALRSRNVFRPTSFAPLTSEVRHKALLRGTPNSKQATNSAAERRECCTSASTDETVGEHPLATLDDEIALWNFGLKDAIHIQQSTNFI